MIKIVNARLSLSQLNSEMILTPLDRRRFVVVYLHLTFTLHHWLAAPQNECEHMLKFVFFPLKGNTINQSK